MVTFTEEILNVTLHFLGQCELSIFQAGVRKVSTETQQMKEAVVHNVLQNRHPYKIGKFHRKTPVLESLFSKVTGPKVCNFIKKRLQHKCFCVKFAKLLRPPFFTEYLRLTTSKIIFS